MTKKNSVITCALIFIYSALLLAWLFYNPKSAVSIQLPGADKRPAGSSRSADDVRIGEFFMLYEDMESPLRGQWASFRGAGRDNIIKEKLINDIPTEDYPVLWNITTGEGHAAPAIYNGRVYLLDYDENLSSDMLRCFSLESGKELWRRWYRVPMKRNHGFSRTIPIVGDKYVITLSPKGHIMCLDPITGDQKWSLNMESTFKTEVPFWYTGQCPIIDNETLIIAPAGDSTLLAGIDPESGKVLWETPNENGYKMSHSSIMPLTIAGKRTYVYMAIGGTVGISAEKSDVGRMLWSNSKWQPSVIAPSPLQLNDNTLLLVAGYGSGAAVLNITNNGGSFVASCTATYKPNEGIASEQQTPILYNGKIITVIPKDGGSLRSKLTYFSPSNLKEAIWSSGADERFGLGPYMVIGDKLFIFADHGELFVYKLQNTDMQLLKRQRIMEGIDAWGPLAYADGYLIVRDAHNVSCIKIK